MTTENSIDIAEVMNTETDFNKIQEEVINKGFLQEEAETPLALPPQTSYEGETVKLLNKGE